MKRAFSLGITVADLSSVSIGMVNDMFIETVNDDYDYPYIATQEDMDRL